ncbi:hypothetical protein O0L34_g12262 [Tuta absoluta]|nr:hypothetical protein O0L34_g12262 [Tuta absoluta]
MGSEQSVPPKKPPQRAPPVRRGHTIAGAGNVPEVLRSHEPTTSGYDSPGASMCSDSELPYISYTVDRPIGDSPKTSAKGQQVIKKSVLQRRQLSLQNRKSKRPTSSIVVVKPATDTQLDEDIRRLQEIPTFLPIMRGTLGLPGARDPEVLEGLDFRPWVRVTSRLQAHLAACAQPLAAEQISLAGKIKEADMEVSKLYSNMVEKQRNNARHAERLNRVHEVASQLSRCNSLLNQTLQDIEELNLLLPEDKRLEPFVWGEGR